MKNYLYIQVMILQVLGSAVYPQGTWVQKADFGGGARGGAVGFSINGKGYLGTGNDATTGTEKDLWEYDPVLDTWTQKASFGSVGREFAVGFSIGDYGYIGTGDAYDQLFDFHQYDPVSNTWIKKADFLGGRRRWAVGFSIGDKGYIGTGTNANGIGWKRDLWEYDPATDAWTEKEKLSGGGRSAAVGFSLNNKGYIGCGTIESGPTNDFWQFDPVTNIWMQIADYPGKGRNYVSAFTVGERAYIGGGFDSDIDSATNDFWQYNPATNIWMEVATFPGAARFSAVGFSVDGKGYIGTGHGDGTYEYFADFWEFTPPCEPPENLSTTNVKSTSAKVNWSMEPSAQTYSVRYRKTGTIPWSKVTAQVNYKKLTGLMPDTEYDWAVKSVCDAVNSNSSDWTATQNFSTKPLKLEGERSKEISFEIFPNPLSPSAVISFALNKDSHITIELFDLAGKKINTLLDGNLEAADYEFPLNGEALHESIYFLRIKLDEESSVMKILVQ